MASGSRDESDCATKMLVALTELLNVDRSVFFLPGVDSQRPRMVSQNIEKTWTDTYLEALSNEYNPFRMVPNANFKGRTVDLNRLVFWRDFSRSNLFDFLWSQDIRTEMQVYLGRKSRPEGVVGLFKFERDKGFSEKETAIAGLLARHLGELLRTARHLGELQTEGNILKDVSRNLSLGVIILDNSINTVHMNARAREIIGISDGYGTSCSGITQPEGRALINKIREDCATLRKSINSHEPVPASIHRIFGSVKEYALSCRVINDELNESHGPLYMAEIRGLRCNATEYKETLKYTYGLTGKEIEVLEHVCCGLTNQQIATKLSTCEITVKKHIQHIFDKIGVNSRTSLMCKILNNFDQ